MTSTDETTPTSRPGDAPSRGRRVRWAVIAGVALAIAVAAGVAVAVAGNDGSDTATADGVRLTALQQACRDWMNDQGSPDGSDATWCSDMTGWMQGRVDGGQMMGSMMGDPERMLDTCTRWMATGPATETSDPQAWCSDMVGWMNQHVEDWDDWMHG